MAADHWTPADPEGDEEGVQDQDSGWQSSPAPPPAGGGAAPPQKDHTLGIIALVSGIVGLVLFFCCWGIDFVLGVVALVTGILAHRDNQNYALAGIIMGAIIIIMNIMAILGFISFALLEMI